MRAKAYLDTCIVSGLAKEDLVSAEQEAVMYLLKAHKHGDLKLVTSAVTAREINQIPQEFRRAHSVIYSLLSDVPSVLLGSTTSLSLIGTPGPGREDPLFENLKRVLPDPQDAEHVFQASQNGVQYFVTVDRSTMLKHAPQVESMCGIRLVAPSTLKGLVSRASYQAAGSDSRKASPFARGTTAALGHTVKGCKMHRVHIFRQRWVTVLAFVLLASCADLPDALKRKDRLVINYDGIMCEGTIDEEKAIDEIVVEYAAQLHKKISNRKHYWGLEGERSTCYSLSDLSPSAQADLISELNKRHEFRCAGIEENVICPGVPRRH